MMIASLCAAAPIAHHQTQIEKPALDWGLAILDDLGRLIAEGDGTDARGT